MQDYGLKYIYIYILKGTKGRISVVNLYSSKILLFKMSLNGRLNGTEPFSNTGAK